MSHLHDFILAYIIMTNALYSLEIYLHNTHYVSEKKKILTVNIIEYLKRDLINNIE